MLLDENETTGVDLFDESTLQKKKLISVFWIILGILGFLLGILLVVMNSIEPVGNTEEKLILWYISLGLSSIFGMLAYFGFKTRFSLNKQYDNEKIECIPKYETYFWLAVFIHLILLTYFLWDDFNY